MNALLPDRQASGARSHAALPPKQVRNRETGVPYVLAFWLGGLSGGIQALVILAVVRPGHEGLPILAILLVFASLGLLVCLDAS